MEQPLFKFAWAVDTGDFALLAECFTEDGELVVGDTRLVGRDAIYARLSAAASAREEQTHRRNGNRHLTSNIIVEEWSEDEALLRSYAARFVYDPSGSRVAETGWYHDRVVNDGGTWRIKHRTVNFDSPALHAPL